MTGWTAVLLFKGQGERKTRLGGRLNAAQRQSLSQAMFAHVAGVLQRSPALSDVVLLSDIQPEDWPGGFIFDQGRGMNLELSAAAVMLKTSPLLVIHADLPFLTAADIEETILEGNAGCAIAPDRHGAGTNALALRHPAGFNFAFGPDSFTRHFAAAHGRANIIKRHGISFDIDTAEDLDTAMTLGFRFDA